MATINYIRGTGEVRFGGLDGIEKTKYKNCCEAIPFPGKKKKK